MNIDDILNDPDLKSYRNLFLWFGHCDDPQACWIWRGARKAGRTPRATTHVYGQSVPAARMAWVLFRGPINGLHVCHTCDNAMCVNPDHLFLGTAMDNVRDMWSKGRSGTSVLTVAKVRFIRRSDTPEAVLAKRYGVAIRCIQDVRHGRSWRWVK